jgi:Ca-activated chloride channel family protein
MPEVLAKARLVLVVTSVLCLLALSVSAGAAEIKWKDPKIQALPEKYKIWLDKITLIITELEVEAFLKLDKDYQRDAFIEKFWRIRDPYPDSTRNEYRDQFDDLQAESLILFGSLNEDRSQMLVLNGIPQVRLEFRCSGVTFPLEIWFYDGSDLTPFEFFMLFVTDVTGRRFHLWYPRDGVNELMDNKSAASTTRPFWEAIMMCQDGQDVARIIQSLLAQPDDFEIFMNRILTKDVGPSAEWVATFESYSTDLPDEAKVFEAKLDLSFPDRYQSRTVMEGTITVSILASETIELAEQRSFDFMLSGELLREGRLFENFRYKFDYPANSIAGGVIPMTFQRRLRPGTYDMVLRVEDLNSGKFWRDERQITVPELTDRPTFIPTDPESARILEAAAAAFALGETTLKIVRPRGEMHSGMVRFDTLTTGDEIVEMVFDLNGQARLRKRSPPFSVEFDLGNVPREHRLTAIGNDSEGQEVARDEIVLNGGAHRFAVRLVEPQAGKTYTEDLTAVAAVTVPKDSVVTRVEFYLNEDLLATLFQAPFVQAIGLPESGALAYVRAVAYRPDESSTEDLVFINAPDYLEQMDVEFVELYTTVLDKQLRPVLGLEQNNFSIYEDEVPQTIVRFEVVKDLPIHAGVMLDVSASMEGSIDQARDAALKFFEDTITPKDRAALITFNDHPRLAVKFTNDVKTWAGGLAGIQAERGTSLYDSLIFALYYFNGIRGQRSLLLLSDGKDESSRFDFDDTLEYVHRTGVAIYTIGLGIEGKNSREAKSALTKIAEETGGRSFFIKDISEISPIYASIQEELRSRYLIGYQSSNTATSTRFREVVVKMTEKGQEAKTIRGYYP